MRSTGGGVPGSRSPSKKGGSVGRAISSTAKGKRADFGRPKKVRVSPKVARALSGTANVKRGRVKTKPGRPVQSGGKVGTVRAGRRNEGPDLASAIQTINRLRGVSDRPGVKPPTPVLDAAWKGLKEYQSASQTQKRVLKGFPQVDTEKLVKSDLAGKTVTINGKKRKLKTLGASGSEAAGKALKGVLIPKQAATFGPQKDIQEATKRVARDVIDTTVNTPATVYELGKAGVKAAGGDLGPAKKLAKQATTEDPIGRLVAKGDPSKIVEHPGIAFMEAWGIGHGGGRAAGAAMRRGPKKLRKYASVKREDARVSGTNIREKREYSRNIVANRVQKSRARKGAKKARDLRAEAKRVEKDNPTAAVELRNQANKVDPNEMMGGRAFGDPVRRRVYEESAANTNVARTRRLRNRKAVQPVEKDMSGASADVIQGVVRTKADLEARIARLEAQTKDLSPGERVLQDRQLKSLRKALKDFDPKREADVAKRYAELSHPAEQRLVDLGLLGEGQPAEAASIPFRVDRMGAEFQRVRRKKKSQPKPPAFVKDGRPVTHADAMKAMKAAGVDPKSVSFITHREGSKGAGSNYRASERAVTLPSQKRTGESFKKGLYDNSPEAVSDSFMRAQTVADAVEGWNRNVDALAAREKDGRTVTEATHAKAKKRAADLQAETGREFVPVRLQAFGAKGEQLQKLLESTSPDEVVRGERLVEHLKDFRDESKPGPWTVMPAEAANGLTQVLNGLGGTAFEKAFQKGSQVFRRNILPTRPTWITGNVMEGGARVGINRATPRDYKRGRLVFAKLREIDPAAAEQLEARVLGGGNVGGVTSRMPRRGRDQFKNTSLEGVATRLGRFWDLKAPKATADAWHSLTDLVIDGSRLSEQQFQVALAGRYMRKNGLFDDPVGFRRISDKAIEQAAQGLRGTTEQVMMGRYVDRAYGRYDKWGPSARKAMITYFPFGAWYYNALNFLFHVLPADHPVLVAVAANAAILTRDARKEYGMAFGAPNAVADFVQGSIPADGKYVRLSRYTPFGALIDVPASAAQQLLPQFSGALSAARGQDPFGNEIASLKDNPVGRIAEAGKQLGGGFVPLASPVLEITGKKGAGYFNPFNPVEADPQKAEWYRLLDKRKQVGSDKLPAKDKARLKVLDKKYRKKVKRSSSGGGGWGGGGGGQGWGSG